MGLYGHHIFPRLMEWVMAGEPFHRLRSTLLAPLHGTVLELGIGTGLNLAHYPKTVTSLDAADPADFLPAVVAARCANRSFPVRISHVTAESLPYDNRAFDYVVSTWTLCSIPDPVKALREVGRVLKPDGTLVFLEHGRSDDPGIATWQDRLNPLQNLVGCGCHLNRRIDRLIAEAGLAIITLDRFRMEEVPRLAGELYRGTATVRSGALR